MAKVKKKQASKEPRVEIAPEARPCDVCGKVWTHRLVNGIRTCSACFEAAQAPEKPEEKEV